MTIRPLYLFASLALGLAGTSCAKKTAAKAEGPSAGGRKGATGGVVPVVVGTVVKKNTALSLEAIGAVESQRSIAIKSLITGMLMKVNFQEGQEVKAGDLLFEIDPRPFQNALLSAKADKDKTNAQLENAKAQVERYKSLLGQSMVSKEQYQSLENAQQTLEAQLAGNDAAISNAALQLEYCSIHAPCDGRTGSLGAHEGDLVRASDQTISLVNITQLSPIYVTFAVPQQYLDSLQKYQVTGKIGVAALPAGQGGSVEKGELTFLDNSVDPTTGTIKLKATFPNTDRGLWPGLFVNVNLTLTTLRDQLLVPTAAIQNNQRGQQIYVIRADKTAELRTITVERAVGMDTVVAKGLHEGETVVVDGQVRLRPDSAVDIKSPVQDIPAIRPVKTSAVVENRPETPPKSERAEVIK